MLNSHKLRNNRSNGKMMGPIEMIVEELKKKARQDPGIDDDYICVQKPSLSGNNKQWKAYSVNGPVGKIPHRNERNNFKL